MEKFIRIVLGICFVFLVNAQAVLADRITSALKQLQKKKYEDARTLLDKELRKDSTSAGACYVYALYFAEAENPQFFIDSAYIFVKKAIVFFAKTPEKTLKEWQKFEISLLQTRQLKQKLEAMAFERAKQKNTLQEWHFFIEFYAEATQSPEAVEALHSLAWQQASAKNNLQAYQDFIQNYPYAVQIPEAIKQRDRLIFEQATLSQSYESYRNFLQKYPKNLFADQAASALFYFTTALHTLEVYADFIKQYPTNPLNRRAWAWLQTLVCQHESLDNFLKKYPQHPQYKQLKALAELQKSMLVPAWDGDAYFYLNEQGKNTLARTFEQVPHEHLCGSITEPYFPFIAQEQVGLMNRAGEVLIPAQFDQVERLTTDLYKVVKNAKQGLHHAAGFEILPLQYDAIEILSPALVKMKKNRRWGLATMNGKTIVECKFTEISLRAEFVILTQSELMSVMPVKTLLTTFLQNKGDIVPKYDFVELIEPQYIKVGTDERIGLLNSQNEWVLPMQFSQIKGNSLGAWACEKDSLWYIYTPQGVKMRDSSYQKVAVQDKFIILKKGKHWGLSYADGQILKNYQYDSLAFVGNYLLALKNKKMTAEWLSEDMANANKHLDLTNCKNIRIEKAQQKEAEQYLYAEKNGKVMLYKAKGKNITQQQYNSIYILDNHLINFNQNGKYGIIDTTNKVLLPAHYDGISNAWAGFQHILANAKFGLFSASHNIKIEPMATAQLKLLAHWDTTWLFQVQKNDKQGIIDHKGKELLGFQYKKIVFWNDTSALAQNTNELWQFVTFATHQTPKKITTPTPTKNLPSKTKEKATQDSTITFEDIEAWQTENYQVIVKYKQNGQWGLWSNEKGRLTPPIYTQITNVGTATKPLFLLEQQLKNKKSYQFSYLTMQGTNIWSATLPVQERTKMLCEEGSED